MWIKEKPVCTMAQGHQQFLEKGTYYMPMKFYLMSMMKPDTWFSVGDIQLFPPML